MPVADLKHFFACFVVRLVYRHFVELPVFQEWDWVEDSLAHSLASWQTAPYANAQDYAGGYGGGGGDVDGYFPEEG